VVGKPEKELLRGEQGLSTDTVKESKESLRAQNIRLICGPTWRAKPEKEPMRREQGLSTYSV
jgi:hypothetical protein